MADSLEPRNEPSLQSGQSETDRLAKILEHQREVERKLQEKEEENVVVPSASASSNAKPSSQTRAEVERIEQGWPLSCF